MNTFKIKLFLVALMVFMFSCDKEDFSESSAEELTIVKSSSSSCSNCDSFSMYNTNLPLLKDQAKSVGQIYTSSNLSSSNRLCSGTLVNHTSSTKKLYFLSAAHCLRDFAEDNPPTFVDRFLNDQLTDSELATEISQINNGINQWVVRFDYECSSSTVIKPGFTIGGLELKAINFQTDMALFEIKGSVSNSNKEKLRLSGWSRSSSSSSYTAYSVHHPASNPKKFAISNTGYTTFNNSHGINTFPQNMARSNFWYTLWGTGGFSGGSSGSGLINNSGKLVGFLTGGDDSNIVNCINDEVAFGKFNRAWYWTASSANYYKPQRTLRNWLAPGSSTVQLDEYNFGNSSSGGTSSVAATNLNVTYLNVPCSNQLWCGEIKLSWTAGSNVTYKIFRRINTGPNVLIKTINTSSTSTYVDPSTRSWADNDNISYTLSSFDSNGTFISNMIVATTGGLIEF